MKYIFEGEYKNKKIQKPGFTVFEQSIVFFLSFSFYLGGLFIKPFAFFP